MNPYYSSLTRFFIPLALQSAAQSLTYPLVAMVASRGDGGALNLAGLAQSNTIMFLLGNIGGGLITTGMVFGKTREGFNNYIKVNRYLSLIVLALQAFLSIPYFSHIVFGELIGLPPSIELPARLTFLTAIPLQFLFFLRNPYQVALFNAKAPGKASLATFCRISTTLLLSPIFCKIGLVGPIWAVICLTIPVGIETYLSKRFARPYIKALKSDVNKIPPKKQIFIFNFPLSIGGFFLAMSAMTMGAFIARAPNPEIMLPVFYLAIGLVNPFSFAVSRIQTVVLTFPPPHYGDHRTLKFGIIAGLFAGLLPLVFILPVLSEWYYVKLQNLNPENLHLIRMTAFLLVLQPLSVMFRAHSEGLAAWMRKPVSILSGQAVYLGSIVTTAFFCLAFHVPGNLIGPACIILANIVAAMTVRMSLQWEKKEAEVLVPGATPSQES